MFPIICRSRFEEFDLGFFLSYWTEYEGMERLRELLELVEEIQSWII